MPTGVAGLQFLDEADAINSYVAELRSARASRRSWCSSTRAARRPAYTGADRPMRDRRSMARPSPTSSAPRRRRRRGGLGPRACVHERARAQRRTASPSWSRRRSRPAPRTPTSSSRIDPDTGDVVVEDRRRSSRPSPTRAGPHARRRGGRAGRRGRGEGAPLVNAVGRPRPRRAHARPEPGRRVGARQSDRGRAAPSMGTDFAFMNPGGIRADLPPVRGHVGQLFTVQPFGNTWSSSKLTGAADLRRARAAVGRPTAARASCRSRGSGTRGARRCRSAAASSRYARRANRSTPERPIPSPATTSSRQAATTSRCSRRARERRRRRRPRRPHRVHRGPLAALQCRDRRPDRSHPVGRSLGAAARRTLQASGFVP